MNAHASGRRPYVAGAVLAAALVAIFLFFRARSAAAPNKDGAPPPTSLTQAESPALKLVVTDLAVDASTSTPAPAPNANGAVTLGWGSGDHDVGRSRPEEGNPEAPMSLAFDAAGNTLVLDQVNGRLLRIGKDGRSTAISLPLQSPQDVAVAKDGTIAVLDRLTDKGIALIGADGKVMSTLPLEGKGVDETGGLTGVFIDGKDVYVEREHGTLVRVGDTSGNSDALRPELPGRPSKDGRLLLSAGITESQTGRLFMSAIDRATDEHLFTRELRMGMPVYAILLLESDAAGTIYLATAAEMPGSGDPIPAVFLTCLSPNDGQPIHTVQLPANTAADETFREMTVAPEGGVVYAYRTESGMTLGRYDCR